KKHPYEKMRSRLRPGQYEDWVADSLKLAQEEVFSPDLKRWEVPSSDYKKKALKIAEEQLALAGYRMGDLFNQAFTTISVPTPALQF
ncbi:MAG TPA: S1/P1 nuclease, partial [Pyrinomonadaceae bacterium]|nr:S1/P1 nuclease [Pyrinomonadaceae bacterium]